MNKKTLLEESKIAEEIMQKGSHVSPLAIKVFGGEGKMAGSAFQQEMEHINEAAQNAMKSNLTESFFGVAKKEVITEAKKPTKPQQTFEVGDKVVVASDALVQHARSVPAGAGYSSHQFSFRDALDKLEKSGAEGTVKKVFDSGRMNVDFGGKVFDLAPNMVSKKEAVKETVKEAKESIPEGYKRIDDDLYKVRSPLEHSTNLRITTRNAETPFEAKWAVDRHVADILSANELPSEAPKYFSPESKKYYEKKYSKKSMKEGYRGPGEREKPYKIYIDGEFFLKTKHPDSVIDLQIEPEFNVDDVEWKDDEGEIYVTTKPEEDEEKTEAKEQSINLKKIKSEIVEKLRAQEKKIVARKYGKKEATDFVFEDDVVEQVLKNHGLSEKEVDLEDLRDLQHGMLNGIDYPEEKTEATDLSFYKNLAQKKGLEKMKKEKETEKAKKSKFNYLFKRKMESLVNKMLDRGLVLAESKVNESRKLAYFLSERFIPALEVFVEAKEDGISVKDIKEAMRLQKQGNLSGNQLAKSLDIYADRGEYDGSLESAIECLKRAEYEINEAKEESEKEEKELSVKEAKKVLEKVLGGFKTLLDKVTEKDVQEEIQEYISDIEAILNPEEDEEGEDEEGNSEKEEPKEIEENAEKKRMFSDEDDLIDSMGGDRQELIDLAKNNSYKSFISKLPYEVFSDDPVIEKFHKKHNEAKEIEEAKFKSVKVIYDDGNEITTSVNPNVSDEDIKKYFRVGSSVNFGDTDAHPKDKMVKIKKVEILGVKDWNQNESKEMEDSSDIEIESEEQIIAELKRYLSAARKKAKSNPDWLKEVEKLKKMLDIWSK